MMVTDKDRASITANNIMNDIINLDIKGEDCGFAMDKVYENIMKLIEDRFSDQWRDISTAPKDETVLICHPEAGVCQSWYESKKGVWYVLDGRNIKEYSYHYSDLRMDLPCLTYLTSNPTHWQPLPTPIKVKDK